MSDARWDDRKERDNRAAHGVGFPEAATVFKDPDSVTWFDGRHSRREDRYLTVGVSDIGRLLTVVTAFDKEGKVRVISARRPSGRERNAYATRRPPT